MTRPLFLSVLVMLFLTSCATTPPPPAPRNPSIDLELSQANSMLDSAMSGADEFYSAFKHVQDDLKEFYSHPGWLLFGDIIRTTPSAVSLEGDFMADLEAKKEVQIWSKQFEMPWERMFARYAGLVDRCALLEARRAIAVAKINYAQSIYRRAGRMEMEAGRTVEAQSLFAMADTLSGPADELEAFALNDLGLYDVRTEPPARAGR